LQDERVGGKNLVVVLSANDFRQGLIRTVVAVVIFLKMVMPLPEAVQGILENIAHQPEAVFNFFWLSGVFLVRGDKNCTQERMKCLLTNSMEQRLFLLKQYFSVLNNPEVIAEVKTHVLN
jgi:hypothetical protein